MLEESFKRYYFDHFDLIGIPPKPFLREFGYQKFNSGMTRHLHLRNDRELRLVIMQNSPSDIYCSNGHYSFPDLPMAEKDWREADLIFDIDAKDLNLPCRPAHTFKKCGSCGRIFLGDPACPHCKSAKNETKSLPCADCIGAAKKEIKKLSDILTGDLGVDRKSIAVYFSGNEGFHVHVPDTQFQKLNSRERRGIVDYITFTGAIPERFGIKRYKQRRSEFPTHDEKGWRGRLSREILNPKSQRSKIVTKMIEDGYDSFAGRLRDLSPVIGAVIDPNVTMDVHRIFRLAGSLNGKSGLAKIPCPDIDGFDPYDEACLIDADEVRVTADVPAEFMLKNTKFGPYGGESVVVPRFAAAYMVCKGLATIAPL